MILFPGDGAPANGYQVGDVIVRRPVRQVRIRDLEYFQVTEVGPDGWPVLESISECPDRAALEKWVAEQCGLSPTPRRRISPAG